MIDHKFTLEAAREALLGAQERGADLERALDHERTARLQAEELAERLQAGWDSNAQVGARALTDIRSFRDAALGLVACATEAIRRADKAEERVAALEARGCSSEGHCPCCAEKLDRLRQERADALSVTSRDGLLSSEWVLRTGQAEERVAELEAENKRLSDRQEHDFSNNVRLIDQVAALRDRVTELEADEFRLDEDNCCDGNEENCDGCHYCAKRRTQLLFAAQGRVAELERLIDEHEFAAEEQRNGFGGATYAVCPECRVARQSRLPGNHTGDCPWGQAAANHRARQPVEGRDFERMPGVAND